MKNIYNKKTLFCSEYFPIISVKASAQQNVLCDFLYEIANDDVTNTLN